MSIYYINITLGDQRDVIVVDNVHEEYGPEKSFFNVWLGSNKNLKGGGETVEIAIEGLFHNWEFRKQMSAIQEQMFSMIGNTNWYQPTELMMGLDAQLRAAGG